MPRIIISFLLAPIIGLLSSWGLFLILVTGSYEAILAMLVLAVYVYIPALILGAPIYWLTYRIIQDLQSVGIDKSKETEKLHELEV